MLLLFRPSPGGGINIWGLTVVSDDSSLTLAATAEVTTEALAVRAEDSTLTLTVIEEQSS